MAKAVHHVTHTRAEQTRCGLVGVPNVEGTALLNENGGEYLVTGNATAVSCRKCRNLINGGSTHG